MPHSTDVELMAFFTTHKTVCRIFVQFIGRHTCKLYVRGLHGNSVAKATLTAAKIKSAQYDAQSERLSVKLSADANESSDKELVFEARIPNSDRAGILEPVPEVAVIARKLSQLAALLNQIKQATPPYDHLVNSTSAPATSPPSGEFRCPVPSSARKSTSGGFRPTNTLTESPHTAQALLRAQKNAKMGASSSRQFSALQSLTKTSPTAYATQPPKDFYNNVDRPYSKPIDRLPIYKAPSTSRQRSTQVTSRPGLYSGSNKPVSSISRFDSRWVSSHFTSSDPGLRNLGNTCYQNSILQALMALEPFIQSLHSPRLASSTPLTANNTLYHAMVDLANSRASRGIPSNSQDLLLFMIYRSLCLSFTLSLYHFVSVFSLSLSFYPLDLFIIMISF